MAYEIRKSNNDLGATVQDGTLNTKFDITLIGKNYAGYGIPQNENFLHLLENFSNNAPPANAINGQVWYDNSTKRLKVNTGSAELKEWHTLSVIESIDGPTPPTNLSVGNFWWNTQFGHLYCKTASNLEFIGGSSAGRPTQMKVRSVKDDENVSHDIIEAMVANVTVFVIYNGTTSFTLRGDTDNTITGFTSIKPGITANSLDEITNVTAVHKFWGTATDADSLGGVAAMEYISVINPYFADNGLTIGNGSNKQLYIYNDIDDTTYPIIENKLSEKILFKTTVGSAATSALELNGADIFPGESSVSNIGAEANKFNEVHALAFKGTADHADALLVGSTYATASEEATAGTIVARTALTGTYLKIASITDAATFDVSQMHVSSGRVHFKVKNLDGNFLPDTYVADISAGVTTITFAAMTTTNFQSGFEVIQVDSATDDGILGAVIVPAGSVRARYFIGTTVASGGDIAEKYLADSSYDEGSVLMIGGEQEVTAAKYGKRALGVISVNPSVIMNTDLANGTLIALKGRAPVKVDGPVIKGDHLIATDTGMATVLKNQSDAWLIFAIALESNSSNAVKNIEAVIL